METIRHSIATGWGRGALYAALAYDANDKFGGMAIKQLRFNPDASATAIAIGVSGTEIALTVAAQRAISIHTTSALATGSLKSVEIAQIHTGASTANNIEVLKVQLTSDVKTGAWANAIFGRINYTANGYAYGSGSAICGEVSLAPGGSHSGQGTYAVFQAELDVPANAIGIGSECSFFRASVWGDQKGLFDDNGFFFVLTGLTDLTGHLWFNNTLRINIGSATWYLPMSSVQASYTTAYPIASTNDNAIGITSTFVPDDNYTDYALAIGWKGDANEIEVSFASANNENLNLIQMNVNVVATVTDEGPTNSSQMNLMHSLITHDTDDMDNLRLKCTDFNIVIKKDIKDAYAYQGEIDFSAANIAVGGEAVVLGLVMNAGTQAVTGNLRGLTISMQGNGGMPAGAMGIEIRTTCTTRLAQAIGLKGTPQPEVGIAMGDRGNDNEGPQFAFFFPSGPSGDEGPVVHSVDAGNGEGSIKIKIGSSTKYLKYWTDPS